MNVELFEYWNWTAKMTQWLVNSYRHFGEAFCMHFQGLRSPSFFGYSDCEDVRSNSFWNTGKCLPIVLALYLRKLEPSSTLLWGLQTWQYYVILLTACHMNNHWAMHNIMLAWCKYKYRCMAQGIDNLGARWV